MRLRNRSTGAERPAASRARDQIALDLARLGVADGVRDELSSRLEALARNLSEDAYDAALAGVALAHALHREGEDALRKSVRDLHEVQRLLGAFSDEMRKLDDALQILSTYVRRMRSRAHPAERAKILH